MVDSVGLGAASGACASASVVLVGADAVGLALRVSGGVALLVGVPPFAHVVVRGGDALEAPALVVPVGPA